jgi:hypothetical protein
MRTWRPRAMAAAAMGKWVSSGVKMMVVSPAEKEERA